MNAPSIGRGTLYFTLANAVFLASGFVIRFWLARYLGPVEFGIYGVVIGLMEMWNNFLMNGLPRSASKFISEDYSRTGSVIRSANRVQLVLVIVLFALYFGLAGFIADLLNDPSLTPYIRLSAITLPAYAFFSIYRVGYLNGLRQYGKQAFSNILHSFIKIGVVFLLVLLGFGVKGAILGYAIAATLAFFIVWWFLRPVEKSEVGFGWQTLLRFGIPVALFTLVGFFLGLVSLFVLKMLGDSDDQVGYYTLAIDISKFIGFLTLGLGMALFPAISFATAQKDILRTRRYIAKSLRYVLILMLPVALLISATSSDLATLIGSSAYEEAGEPLAILVFGAAAMSIFTLFATIIIGSGKPVVALGIIGPMIVFEIVLNVILIPAYGMEGGAVAHTVTGVLGMCAGAIYVFVRHRIPVNLKSSLRICLSAVAIHLLAYYLPVTSFWLVPFFGALLVLYAGLLLVSGELGREDWATLEGVIPWRRIMRRQ